MSEADLSGARPPLGELRILIRGAGDLASGVGHRLFRSNFPVIMTEVPHPLAVRRSVSFCEAIWDGATTVEGVTARLASDSKECLELTAKGEIPVLVDPDLTCLAELKPQVIVDATIAKKNLGLSRDMAPLTIGLGPGFLAPGDVHLAIETKRGHDLGKLIYQGTPSANTGEPGVVLGHSFARVLRAPCDGVFEEKRKLGDMVEEGEIVASVNGEPVKAGVSGVIRGLIRPGVQVESGLKVGDVDPRSDVSYLDSISDKARALGGAVLEGILARFNR